MKGKGGPVDRRSSARWRLLVLCAFSFGIGMLFTDRWVFPFPSPSLHYTSASAESFGSRRALPLRLEF
jgi:beta-1,3-galactosyltransferase 1/2/3/4/5/7/8